MARKQEAHHGGAWKVAYADFVTAMMALFMVLWISAQDPKIVLATSEYFQNPFVAAAADATSGVMPFSNKRVSTSEGSEKGKEKERDNDRQVKLTLMNSVAADFMRMLHLEDNMAEKPVDFEISADGLRITIFNRVSKPVFIGDTAEFTEWGSFVIQNLAWQIDRHRFRVIIDGHTRGNLMLKRDNYSSWELSSDRALATRRALVRYAVDPAQIDHVTGYGDTHPIPGVPVESEQNQRIMLSLSLSTRALKDTKVVEQPVRTGEPAPSS